MRTKGKRVVIALSLLLISTELAAGQGIPVIDQSAIAKQIESITQLKSQLDTLNQQLQQAQQLYVSLNKITNMADVANLLNDPSIRRRSRMTSTPSRDCSRAQGPASSAVPLRSFLSAIPLTVPTLMTSTPRSSRASSI